MQPDPRDERTRERDRDIWVAVMGEDTPDDIMDASLYALPQELAAMAVASVFHRDASVPLPWPVEELGAEAVCDSLERTLKYEGVRGRREPPS